MQLRLILLAAALLGPTAPGTAVAEDPPETAGGLHRVRLTHLNPSARTRSLAFRVRLSGRARDSYAARRNESSDRRFRTPWSRRREEFGPEETRTLEFEFPITADAPPLLGAEAQILGAAGWRPFRGEVEIDDGAEAQILGAAGWRPFRGEVEIDDGAAPRLRPPEAGGTPVPFRVLAAAHDRGGLPAGGSVARTAREWDALRETMGFLSPVAWDAYPSIADPGPWDWGFRGLPAYPAHHSTHAPDFERESVIAIASTRVGIRAPFSIRSVEARDEGVLVVRWFFIPCEPHYYGYILEPFCAGSDDTILIAVPRTDAPIEFERVLE